MARRDPRRGDRVRRLAGLRGERREAAVDARARHDCVALRLVPGTRTGCQALVLRRVRLKVAVVGSGPGGVLHGRRAAEERGPAGRGRRARPAADAVGARPARRRARPREHQGRLARVREDRRAAGLPVLRQRRGRLDRLARRAARDLRRGRLHRRRADRPPARHPRRGSARIVAGHRVRRLVQRPSRLPGPRLRPRMRAGRRDRERQRRDRLRPDAGAHRRASWRRPTRSTRRPTRSPPRRCARSSCSAAAGPCRPRSRRRS